MEKTIGIIFLCALTTSAIALPIDYDGDDVAGNLINDKDVIAYLQSNDINDFQSAQNAANEADKRDPEMYVGSQKRNIISALRAKMRRSKVEDEGDKMRFSPVLSVDAFGNMNDFFDNLATNLHTMENRNLLPNQMRLLGESENLRPKDMVHGHSAAFINSVRSFQSPPHIRKLMEYVPGKRCRDLTKDPLDGTFKCDTHDLYPSFADFHRNSNFYDPKLARIGLGK